MFSAFFPGWSSLFMAQKAGGRPAAQPAAQKTDPTGLQRHGLKKECADGEQQQE